MDDDVPPVLLGKLGLHEGILLLDTRHHGIARRKRIWGHGMEHRSTFSAFGLRIYEKYT